MSRSALVYQSQGGGQGDDGALQAVDDAAGVGEEDAPGGQCVGVSLGDGEVGHAHYDGSVIMGTMPGSVAFLSEQQSAGRHIVRQHNLTGWWEAQETVGGAVASWFSVDGIGLGEDFPG
jgi:hypothetical protein